jgi:hypothetical protein
MSATQEILALVPKFSDLMRDLTERGHISQSSTGLLEPHRGKGFTGCEFIIKGSLPSKGVHPGHDLDAIIEAEGMLSECLNYALDKGCKEVATTMEISEDGAHNKQLTLTLEITFKRTLKLT